ncbi:hypothetical protein NE237_028448 [Protea cynaroides]|uniref:BHLH domain-containing protein n=1 Tax=Protea cynaroides TaxID=273540 RepID=A0A9Q0JTV2_9MAGN|nr:hypothetical protein NE237_028448 [Protea cynaroides]
MGERPKRMDFIPQNPIFPLQHSDELCFQVSSTFGLQHTDPQQDTLFIPPPVIPNETCNEKNKKKIMHRDFERQRRQEMASLYESLRSLLPLEYLKGKRSISDHMNEAANYIRDLRKRIDELSDKRDGLRNIPNSGASDEVSDGCSPDCVTVQPCWGGVEVVISSDLNNGEFPLSSVLRVLVGLGFTVISCVSTTINQKTLYNIQSELLRKRIQHNSFLSQVTSVHTGQRFGTCESIRPAGDAD